MKLLIAVDSALSTEVLVRAVLMQPWPDGTTAGEVPGTPRARSRPLDLLRAEAIPVSFFVSHLAANNTDLIRVIRG